MKFAKIFFVLALGVFLAVPAYGKKGVIQDPDPINMRPPGAFYEYRGRVTWSQGYEGGGEGRSGAYFRVGVNVILDEEDDPDNYLESYDDVIGVKAKHLGTEKELLLLAGTCITDHKTWFLKLLPQSWMFEGTWEFTLLYNGSDGKEHQQIAYHEMGPKLFAQKPSHILIAKEGSDFMVSWSAIGNPHTGPFEYRVRKLNEDGCELDRVQGNWKGIEYPGWYDVEVNRVNFPIPYTWLEARIRLENIIYTENWAQVGRAFQYLRLRLPE